MAYIVVDNFSAGLDTRRHPLTAKPGTLQGLKNAHITRGGEIEKRKKFAEFVTMTSNQFPSGTFGMEATADKIYVFCDDWNSSTSDTTLNVTNGGGVVVAQLIKHPDWGVNPPYYPRLNGIVFSTLYGGKPFVLAKFSDGSVYPYWDGKIVRDFVNGFTRSTMGNLIGVAAHMRDVINTDDTEYSTGYTATASGNVVTITGPAGAKWTPSATADSPITVSTSVTVQAKDAVSETPSKASFAITAGSQTPAQVYQSGRNLDAASLPGIRSVRVGASTPTSADGIDLLGWGSTTGLKYNTYPPDYVTGANCGSLYYNIRKVINENTSSGLNHGYSATSYLRAYNSGNDTNDLIIYAPAVEGSNANGRLVQIEFDADPTGVYDLYNLVNPATVAPSPYNAGKFIATMGTMAGGSTNAVTSVKVDGVEVMGAEQKWNTSNSKTMQDIVDKINSFTSSVEYTASFEDNKVVLRAVAGSGSAPNGRIISITTVGDVVASSVVNFSGGVSAQAAVSQKATFVIGGSFAPGLKVSFVVTPNLDPTGAIYFGSNRVTNTKPSCALTFKTKAHLTSGSSLFFSGVNQPTRWNEGGVGAGFINMSNNSGGNEVLTGLALYQGQLAAFARRSIQIWQIDTDPANNRQGQVISNTGALSSNSIVSIGEIDVFYLSDSGIRSVRARDASNAAVVNDVGTPIDSIILAELAGMTDAQKAACPAIIEPIDGRYWIAIGSKIFVFSYFPNSQVAAWSTYEPGFAVSKFATKEGRVYARAGDTIYLYGGANNSEYDNSEVDVLLPYLDGGKPAHMKTLMGVDITCEGAWGLSIGMDPAAPVAKDPILIIDKPTFTLGRVMASGMGTHVGIRLTNNTAGYARIANLIGHYLLNEAD
jgi:hypothetical protein